MKARYQVECDTVFGHISKTFDSLASALSYVRICAENDVASTLSVIK